MNVEFTESEWEMIHYIGRRNTEHAIRIGARDLTVDQSQTLIRLNTWDVIGKRAVEVALGAQECNLFWTSMDYEIDMVLLNGDKAQVKCHKREYSRDAGCFFTTSGRLLADVGIQCQPVKGRERTVEVVGYCLKGEWKAACESKDPVHRRDFGKGRETVIPHYMLHSCEELTVRGWLQRIARA